MFRKHLSCSVAALLTLIPPLTTLASTPQEVVFVMDASGSGTAAEWDYQKEVVVTAIRDYMQHDSVHRIAAMQFESSTTVFQQFKMLLPANIPGIVNIVNARAKGNGNSAIGTALLTARLEILARGNGAAPRTVVIFTDGINNAGPSPCEAGATLAATGIRIIVIGIGGNNYSPSSVNCFASQSGPGMPPTSTPAATLDLPTAIDFLSRHLDFCPADLNNDGIVDDADFTLFVAAYDTMVVPNGGHRADLDNNNFVDDADFIAFLKYYDKLVCPGRLN